MIRERVLFTATDLYSRYGIKGVSMDHLANELKMSKKTLYTEFGSKDELVTECIEYEFRRITKFTEKTKQESTCAFEAIVRVCTGIASHLSSVCPAFFKDIGRYMDADRILEQRKVNLWERSSTLLRQGIEEGDILADADLKLIMSILIEQISHIKPAYSTPVVMTLLRGISTPQGLGKLEVYYTPAKEYATKNLNIE